MAKYLKVILIALIVIALFILAFFGSGTNNKYDSIEFNDYKNLKDNNIVYIGNDASVLDSMKEMEFNKEYVLSFLNYNKLNKEQKKKVKEESIEIYKDGKKQATYTFDMFNLGKKDKKLSLETVSDTKYLKLINEKGLHFMFVGSETCGYCTQFKETIKELYKNYKINIYYVDLASLDETGYNNIISSDSYFNQEEWGTPTSMIYYNGKRIEVISGYRETSDLIDILNNNIGIKVFLIDNKVM